MSVTKFITRDFGCNLLSGVSLPHASFAWNITEPYATALQWSDWSAAYEGLPVWQLTAH